MYEHRGNSVSFLNFKTYLLPSLSLLSLPLPLPRKVFLVRFATTLGRIIQHLFPRPCFCLCTSRASLLRSYILTFELHRQFIALTHSSSSSRYLPFRNVPSPISRARASGTFVPRYYPFSVHFINISSQLAARFWDKRATSNLIVTVCYITFLIQFLMYRSSRDLFTIIHFAIYK